MFYMVFKGFFNMKGIFCCKNKWEDLSKDSFKKIERQSLFLYLYFEKRKSRVLCEKEIIQKHFSFNQNPQYYPPQHKIMIQNPQLSNQSIKNVKPTYSHFTLPAG